MIKLPKIEDPRGNLSFIEAGPRGACPFEIVSVRWIYDMPSGHQIGYSLDTDESQLNVAMSGSFDMVLESDPLRITLNRSDRGIEVGPGDGLKIDNFSTNSVLLQLSTLDLSGKQMEEEIADPESSHQDSDISDASYFELPRIPFHHGSMTFVSNGCDLLPFKVRRVFYLYDVPADAERGGHSHYKAQELIVALTGSFDVVLDDGKNPPERFTLNRPYQGLYVPAGMWRTLDDFSGGSVCMVLTSEPFSEEDYVRDYDKFKQLTSKK